MITHAALMAPPWWLALLLAGCVSIIALQFKWLTTSGALSAAIVGAAIYWLGGMYALAPLLVFFFTGSILSILVLKTQTRSRHVQYGPRSAAQVWANGVIPVLLVGYIAIIRGHVPEYQLPNIELLYLSALAAVNADTWATEIGMLFGGSPRSLRTWKLVAPGSSGAVTAAGIVGTIAGAIVLPASVARLWQLNAAQLALVAWAGVIGSFSDSIMGASIQAGYRSRESDELFDAPGSSNLLQARGLRWITNDTVNLLTSLIGVLAAIILMKAAANLFGV